jgi:hypothetical protein
MRKLKLDVDALRVESFEADRGRGSVGTVRGNMPVDFPADEITGDGGNGSGSGVQTCPNTLKYECPTPYDLCTPNCPTYVTLVCC